jgi:hypothetical protein
MDQRFSIENGPLEIQIARNAAGPELKATVMIGRRI